MKMPCRGYPSSSSRESLFYQGSARGITASTSGAPARTAPPQSPFTPNFTEPLWCAKILPPPSRIRQGNKINSPLAPPGRKQGKIDSSGHRTRAPTRFRNGRVPLDQPRLNLLQGCGIPCPVGLWITRNSSCEDGSGVSPFIQLQFARLPIAPLRQVPPCVKSFPTSVQDLLIWS